MKLVKTVLILSEESFTQLVNVLEICANPLVRNEIPEHVLNVLPPHRDVASLKQYVLMSSRDHETENLLETISKTGGRA